MLIPTEGARMSCHFSRALLALMCTLLLLQSGYAEGIRTSENDARMRKWLTKFPQADANGDGILTLREAKAYRRVLQQERKRRGKGESGEELPPRSHADLKYGPHERNVLDLWLPKDMVEPVPLLVYIHGGGFVAGSKEKLSPDILKHCLDTGIAVASINYRFVTTEPFPTPFHDGARAIQYLRYRAEEFKIDPKRFGVYGGSAGGGISMWIGCHDDLADAESPDPVARQSSRVCAVGSMAGQSSYDFLVIREWLGDGLFDHPSAMKIYGCESVEELKNPSEELRKLMAECSAIQHVTPDDPPLIMFYKQGGKNLVHSIVFGREMKKALDAQGIEALLNPGGPGGQTEVFVRFFARAFGLEVETD